jgi:hypothetical protein
LPIGKDSRGRKYWYFNDTRLYRETPYSSGKFEEPLDWELLCDSTEDWETFQTEFQGSKNKPEKELHAALEEIIPGVISRLVSREREAKRQGETPALLSQASGSSHLIS